MKRERPKSWTGIPRLLIRLVLGFCLMAAVLYAAGPYYLRLFVPLFKHEIALLHPEYEIRQFYLDEKKRIIFEVRVNRRTIDEKGRLVGGTEVKAGILGWTMYSSPLILFSLLLAWPGLPLRTRAKAFLISLPLWVFTQLVDIPFLCINRIEAPWPAQSAASQARIFWAFILANGGRQFMAFFAAILSIVSAQWASAPRPKRATAKQEVGRNDPCPCGSGKKFKKCCGR